MNHILPLITNPTNVRSLINEIEVSAYDDVDKLPVEVKWYLEAHMRWSP